MTDLFFLSVWERLVSSLFYSPNADSKHGSSNMKNFTNIEIYQAMMRRKMSTFQYMYHTKNESCCSLRLVHMYALFTC